MTRAARRVHPATHLRSLTGRKVITDLLGGPKMDRRCEHIAVAHPRRQRYDVLVVAPATADLMAKFAYGLADDFLTTLYPGLYRKSGSCSRDEHEHVAASGHTGQSGYAGAPGLSIVIVPGRLVVLPAEWVRAAWRNPWQNRRAYRSKRSPRTQRDLEGETVLVTAGPTQEALDPVRYHQRIAPAERWVTHRRCRRRPRCASRSDFRPGHLTPPPKVSKSYPCALRKRCAKL